MKPTHTISLKTFSEAIEAGIAARGSWPMPNKDKEALRALVKPGTVFSNSYAGDDGPTEAFPGCPLSLIGADRHFAARWKGLFVNTFDQRIMDEMGFAYCTADRIKVTDA